MEVPPRAVRNARWAVSAVFFMDGMAIGSWTPHLASVKDRLHLSSAELGTALLASAIGAVLTMPFAGYPIHRFGSRTTALISGLLLCAGLASLLLMPTLAAFVAVLFFVGVTNGHLDVSMNAHSMAVQDRCDRQIISAIHGWFSVGGFAGGLFASLGAKAGIAPSSSAALSAGVLAVFLVLVNPYMLPAKVDAKAEGLRFVMPTGTLALLGVMATFSFLSEGAVWDWAAVYLRKVLFSGPALGALGFGLFSLGMAAGRFAGDRAVHALGPVKVLTGSAFLAGGALGLAVLCGQAWAAIAAFTLVGFGLANIVPVLFRAASTKPGIPAATGLAAVTTCGYSGFLFGPPAIGLVAEARSLGFALAGVAVLCLFVGMLGPRALAGSRD